MKHPVLYTLPAPLSDADPYQVQQALDQIRQEMECASDFDPIEYRLDRLEAFARLSDQHTANVINETQ